MVLLPSLCRRQTTIVNTGRICNWIAAAFPAQAWRRPLFHNVVVISFYDDVQFRWRKIHALLHGCASRRSDNFGYRNSVLQWLDFGEGFQLDGGKLARKLPATGAGCSGHNRISGSIGVGSSALQTFYQRPG